MRRLIARRPVLYQGRTYQQGDCLPAADPLMAAAWLKSGSAVSTETAPAVPMEASGGNFQKAERQALECLAGLGLKFVDKSGEFVGNENFTAQICALAQNLMQDYEDLIPPASGIPADGRLPEEDVLDICPDGHFTRASLSQMNRAQLTALAEDAGVDLSGCRTNAERVEALLDLEESAEGVEDAGCASRT